LAAVQVSAVRRDRDEGVQGFETCERVARGGGDAARIGGCADDPERTADRPEPRSFQPAAVDPAEPAADADVRSDHRAAQPPDSRRADRRRDTDAHPERGGNVAGTDPFAGRLAHASTGSNDRAADDTVTYANSGADDRHHHTRHHARADRQSNAGGDGFGSSNDRAAVGRMADRTADRDRRWGVGVGRARRIPPRQAS
jgi:hypothetical protein